MFQENRVGLNEAVLRLNNVICIETVDLPICLTAKMKMGTELFNSSLFVVKQIP